MRLEEFKEILEQTGMPVAYKAFPVEEIPEMPFITYEEQETDNFGADNIVWHSFRRMQVYLFTRYRNEDAEELIEDAFNKAGIFWQRDPNYDSAEKVTRTIYSCEV